MYYFIRANGDTLHNNPNRPQCYVPGEPPTYPASYFNGLKYCFDNNIARIGWPDCGDLRRGNKARALARCYDLYSLPSYVRTYLETFRDISVGSLVLVPDKDASGTIYIAEVTSPYHYFHDIPVHPYEHAHRLGVRWDRNAQQVPIAYRAHQLGIGIRGGFWTRAFAVIDHSADADLIIEKIKAARKAD